MVFKPTSSQLTFYTKSSDLDNNIWNQSLIQVFPRIYTYEQLNNAYNYLRRDHEGLRVRFKETADGVVSYVEEYKHIEFPFIKVGSDEELLEEARKFVNLPLDFHNILVNPIIFHTPKKSGIMISAHHIAVDGYCSYVLSKDINKYLQNPEYRAVTQTYAEHIEREEKHKQSKRFFSDREFWKKKFSTNPTCNIFSSQKSTPGFSSMDFSKEISVELVTKVKSFCTEYEISPTSFFNTVYAAYLHRTYDVDNFTIGVPVLNRTTQAELNTIGLYMHTVPLVINIQSESFFENAKRINDLWLDILRHQKFTQYDIKQMLQEENMPTNTLCDIAADFLEFEPNKEYEIIVPYGNNLTVPVELHLQSFSEEVCTFRICYQKSYFTEEKIQIMFDSIISLMENAVEHPFENINSIEMISAVEKNKILYDFNNTVADYPKENCVHTLLEEIAEKTPEQNAVVAHDKTLTYKELNEEANKIAHALIEKGIGVGDIVAFSLKRKSYLISAIFGILKVGAAYLPIDPDYPESRIEYILSDSEAKCLITDDHVIDWLRNDNISNSKINISSESPCYCIYTSGSTGRPKGTIIRHRNLRNFCSDNAVNYYQNFVAHNCSNILSCGAITFDICTTEIMLALTLNKTLVLADETDLSNINKLAKLFNQHKVDCILCTPTKLHTYLSNSSFADVFADVKCVLVAGEQLTEEVYNTIKKHCNATIFNGYGPTETAMGVSIGEVDIRCISIGKPIANTQIYIVDKYMNPVPIGVTGELCIAGDGVGAGYINNPELTAEKFVDNPFGEGKLYKTGDIGYWREDGNIFFVGRNDFQVKVRGLRIELGEIENAISAVEGISLTVAVVRKDKADRQLICAFYTGEEKSAKELREEIGRSLPKYMVPHIFIHLDEMPLTSSGKINRNALPEIDLENISTETEYVAPETEKEITLTECIEDILGTEKVGIFDNFFDVGGDSLKAIELTARLEAKGYDVSVKTVFSCKDIRELALALTDKKKEYVKTKYGSVIPATPAQLRVYTSQMLAPNSTLYNVNYAFRTEDIDSERLEKAVNKLIERHESLRTHFENREGVICQVIDEKAEIKVEAIDGENLSSFAKAFDLGKSPLVRVGCSNDTVVIDMHHTIVDGETMPILFRELNELYMGRELKETVQYGEFAVQQINYEESEKYWLEMFRSEVPVLELPTDYPRGSVQSFKGNVHYKFIEKSLHEKIEEKCKQRGITPYVYYMACFSVLLSKLSGNEDIVVGTPISGRTSRFLETAGMFVNTVALRSKPEGSKKISDLFKEIKEDSIAAIDNQNYPFGELVKKLGIESNGRNPLYDVMMAYQSYETTDIIFGDIKAELLPLTGSVSKCDMTFTVLPRKDDVVLATEYCTDLFKEERIEKFIYMYNAILEECLNDEKQIKDISVTDTALIDRFNSTGHNYQIPENSTIYSLFENTANENSDKICIRTAERNLTFGEVCAISENLDEELRKNTKGIKSVIAVIAERSPEMYSAIYGIIRGGNAYLPIDPAYPEDRIEYILKDSNSCAVVAQDKFTHLAGNMPCINMTALIENAEKTENILPSNADVNDTAYVIYTSGSTGSPKGAKISHKSAINRILWMQDKYPLGETGVILQKTPYTFDVSVWELFLWGIVGGSLTASKPGEHFLPAKILEETNRNKVTHLHFVPSVFEIFLNYLEAHRDETYKFESVRYVFLSGEALMADLVKRFYRLFDYGKVTLHNLYGPTECAVDVTYYDCSPDVSDPVPIGKPIHNTQIYVVDRYMNLCPIDVQGELCIAGINVGQGYLNNTELTSEKFIDNPFGEGKLYKTGDLAYLREDGNIIFCGRMDSQIKLNGQRIELGEIESVISRVNGITSTAVIVRKLGEKDALVAYYTGKETDTFFIKEQCFSKLPKYMVPSIFVRLEELPLNPSGKLDKKALAQKEINISSKVTDDVPANETEKYICDTFEKILGTDNIRRNSDFFEMGGTSLSMISLLSEKDFENITAAEFMRNPTPAMLSVVFDSKNSIKPEYLEPLYISGKPKKSLILLPFAGGGAEAYSALVNSLKKKDDSICVYFIRNLHSIEECRKAAEEISEVLGESEFLIYSHCIGSAIALQIISFLENKEMSVKHYFAGASIPPAKPIEKNIWNIVPDKLIKAVLVKAGADIKGLADDRICDLFNRFRKDTDFANISFAAFKGKINAPVSVVISKKDIFTKNYRQAETLWKKYANNVVSVDYIDSNSHYFQSENAEKLAEMLLD